MAITGVRTHTDPGIQQFGTRAHAGDFAKMSVTGQVVTGHHKSFFGKTLSFLKGVFGTGPSQGDRLQTRRQENQAVIGAFKQELQRHYNIDPDTVPKLNKYLPDTHRLSEARMDKAVRKMEAYVAGLQGGGAPEATTELTGPKSDLSGVAPGGEGAHLVFQGGTPELAHASQAFRQFLERNFEQPTMAFVDAYHKLLDNPSREGLDAFISNRVNDPQMNIYEQSKDFMNGRLDGLGDPPSRAEIEHVLGPVIGDVNESFGGDLYGRFLRDYRAG